MPEALAAVMASHMAMCPRCRTELSVLDAIGAVLLQEIRPEPLEFERPRPTLRKLTSEISGDPRLARDIPQPLREFVGPSFGDVKWRPIDRGVWQFSIPLSAHSRGSLRLVKIAPSLTLPDDRHAGSGMVLVLEGALADSEGRCERGDLVEVKEDVRRSLIATQESGCVCLIASEGPTR
jgi:putative transcriptional regulator